MKNEMNISQFNYHLPPERIAQEPLKDRDKSSLLVLHRESGEIEHRRFYQILDYLEPGDLLVMNNTRVSAKRLFGKKATGARVEALLIENTGGNIWNAYVKPGRRIDIGAEIFFDNGLTARVTARTEAGGRALDFGPGEEIAEKIQMQGLVPLPPYIHTVLKEKERYQTVYAKRPGSAAAPTAGFHFTPEIFRKLKENGVQTAEVTLNVGIATFRPVRTENIADHEMHTEHISITPEAADIINSARGRIISVGTTTARVLESAAVAKRQVAPVDMETNLFITPGYDFKIIDGLITNFHMPKSTLLILVSAFAGRENILHAYNQAAERGYRFLSFGDAMFII
jgi:S-adenosylmethionine:tRNA ribosyltransferase-isomerase